jgi:acetyl-CoA carboxylase biotin carboxylase subunit
VRLIKEAGYTNAGTCEFLVDQSHNFYFIEVNARIQVEHPVTELVTISDLIAAQIRVAAGEPIGRTQDEILFVGHAIECRINAEDPDTFTPSPGRITTFNLPTGPGVRVDTAAYAGYFVPPYYDSMIAKLIVHHRTRERAIMRMRRALEATVIEGIKTTIPLHLKIMDEPDFQTGNFSTRFMDRFMK